MPAMAGRTAPSALGDASLVTGLRLFVREFNTFSSRLNSRFVTEYSLTESRVLFAFKDRREVTVGELRAELGIDSGYLSRILTRFEREGLIERTRSERDRRRQHVTITEAGVTKLGLLDDRSTKLMRDLLARLGPDEGPELVAHMERVRELLGDDSVGQWLLETETGAER